MHRNNVVTADVPNTAGQSILYVIGGSSPNHPYSALARVEAYNVATNTWSQKQDLPVALSEINGAGVIGGKIYVAGGHKIKTWGPTTYLLFVYNPATNTWTRKRGMPEHGAGGVTAVIEDKLYVATPTGDQGDQQSNFFRYDPATNQWTRLPSPSHAYFMGGVLYGKLYLVGNQVEAYDPATNQWTAKAPPPADDGALNIWGSAVAAGAKLYAFGGGKILVYSPSTDSWTTRPAGPPSWGAIAGRVFLNGKPRIEFVGDGTDNWQYTP
jgi:N-acetylneuraminic acid mutarotase